MSEFNMPQILSDAADHIEKVGFHKGELFKQPAPGFFSVNPDSPCCTLGAVAVVSNGALGTTKWNNLIKATEIALEIPKGTNVADWNDKPSQRKGRVIAALRRASARLKESQND